MSAHELSPPVGLEARQQVPTGRLPVQRTLQRSDLDRQLIETALRLGMARGPRLVGLALVVHRLVASLAHSTVEVVFGRVVAVFRAAVRDRLIAASPCPGVRVPQGKPASMLPVMTTEDVLAMAGAVPDRYSALVVFGAATGLRPGELFGLTKDRVHFLARRVVVDQQLARTGHGVGLAPLKTRSSYRNVPLAQVASDALAAHLARWSAHPELGLVFCNDWGKPIQQHPFSAMWTTARRKAGVPEWATPHDLRHYFASTLIRSGASVKVIQARLGHASAKTTLDVYGHLFPDEEDRTRAAIDAELANLASPPRPGSLSKYKTAGQRG